MGNTFVKKWPIRVEKGTTVLCNDIYGIFSGGSS